MISWWSSFDLASFFAGVATSVITTYLGYIASDRLAVAAERRSFIAGLRLRLVGYRDRGPWPDQLLSDEEVRRLNALMPTGWVRRRRIGEALEAYQQAYAEQRLEPTPESDWRGTSLNTAPHRLVQALEDVLEKLGHH